MTELGIETIVASSIRLGTIQTLSQLGMLPEMVTKKQAEILYSKRLITEWRSKGWITGYPSKNEQRAGIYFKRSELETASLMLDMNNSLKPNQIKQLINHG
ncbi:MAG: hypothetical protein JXQ69_03660 [Paludibacteraceae bacterium]|nr:hypothetical protein [Paludibacteraceae bacterium]